MIAHIQKCTEEEMQNQLLIEGAEYEKPAFSNTATAFSDITNKVALNLTQD